LRPAHCGKTGSLRFEPTGLKEQTHGSRKTRHKASCTAQEVSQEDQRLFPHQEQALSIRTGSGKSRRSLRVPRSTRKKRQYRRLWIQRIGAAARLNGITYGQLIHGLKAAGISLDRKVLADIAVKDAAGFAQLVEKAKAFAPKPAAKKA